MAKEAFTVQCSLHRHCDFPQVQTKRWDQTSSRFLSDAHLALSEVRLGHAMLSQYYVCATLGAEPQFYIPRLPHLGEIANPARKRVDRDDVWIGIICIPRLYEHPPSASYMVQAAWAPWSKDQTVADTIIHPSQCTKYCYFR
jgi:hypothetical protein